jgi:hypothetical protein
MAKGNPPSVDSAEFCYAGILFGLQPEVPDVESLQPHAVPLKWKPVGFHFLFSEVLDERFL